MDNFNSNNNNFGNNGGYNNQNTGYNGNNPFNSDYNNGYPPNNMYNTDDGMPERKGSGLAIASFVISLVNLILCCTCLSVVTVPLCLIFSIITIAGKRRGKGFAIAGIIISLISGIFFAYYGYIAYKIGPDFMYFVENQNQIIEEYDKDGTIPERFEKYREPKYDKYWDRLGYDSFDEFFQKFIENQKKSMESQSSSTAYDNNDTNSISYIDSELIAAV